MEPLGSRSHSRCEWSSAGCLEGGQTAALSLYDLVLGGGENTQRVASHERVTLSAGAKSFDAWIAVSPSCTAEPTLRATFLARE